MTATHSYNRTLLFALGVHCLLWFLLPTLLQPNANLDVVEGLTWGQEWQLGYDKHPLLAPWLTYAITLLSPASNWPIFLLSQIAVVTAFWAQYAVGRTFLGKQPALVAVLLLTLVPYYNYLAPEFNPNILQLAIWALTVLFGFRAINHNRIRDWILLGVCSGLAMLTKYYAVVLLLSIACYFLTPAGRPFWRQKGIYIALIAAVLVWLPNLIWLIEHDFSTIRYGAARGSGNEKALADHLINPLRFGLSQLAALIILLPTFFLLIRGDRKQSSSEEPTLSANRTFLTLITLGPLIITLLISLATGMRLRSMWGTPLFTFLPLWLMVFSGILLTDVRMKKLIRVWAVTSLFFVSVFLIEMLIAPQFGKLKKRAHFPGEAIATKLTTEWQQRYPQPLKYAVASIWLGGNLAYYSEQHPSILYDADISRSPWIDEDALVREGGLIVWNESMDGEMAQYEMLLKRYPQAEVQPPFQYRWHMNTTKEPVQIGWAIIPPARSIIADSE